MRPHDEKRDHDSQDLTLGQRRALAMRESPCGVKRVEGVELHYNYRQQGEATFSQDVASSNVLPPPDAWSEQSQLSHPALF